MSLGEVTAFAIDVTLPRDIDESDSFQQLRASRCRPLWEGNSSAYGDDVALTGLDNLYRPLKANLVYRFAGL